MFASRRFSRLVPRLAQVRYYSTPPTTSTSAENSSGRVIVGLVTAFLVGAASDAVWTHYGNSKTGISEPTIAIRIEQSDAFPFRAPAPPTPSEVTALLNEEAYAVKGGICPGVSQFFGTRLQSNTPTEDHFLHRALDGPIWKAGQKWKVWGVFDGHVGSEFSVLLTKHLVPYVQNEIVNLERLSGQAESDGITTAIKTAFTKLDDDVMKNAAVLLEGGKGFADTVSELTIGYSGSCALLSLYDPNTYTLRVACTGDSRAVLGRKVPNGNWQTTPLSIDQSGKNADEVARIKAEHPGEPDIIKNGRVAGIAVTRAFGDSRWKWSKDIQGKAEKLYAGSKPRDGLETPPYLTALPEVTTTRIDPKEQSFMIMASDGLWDHMTNEQAVGLVGQWLDWKAAGKPRREKPSSFARFDFGPFEDEVFPMNEAAVTVEDENVAVHLVRNALGGANHDQISGLLAFQSPRSRDARDDVTVQVVFFGEEDK